MNLPADHPQRIELNDEGHAKLSRVSYMALPWDHSRSHDV
jgi:hypothetical protein